MNASVMSALAALAGATIGGFTPLIASLLAQKYQARAMGSCRSKERNRRGGLFPPNVKKI
jgi:hypothetical protein